MAQKSNEKLVFIVEDNEVYAKMLEGYLKGKFPEIHEVKKFKDGESSLMELYQNPSVIIVDHLLNAENGNAATGLSTIKKMKLANPDSNIILLSGQKEFDVVSKAISKYGCKYVPKDEQALEKVGQLVRQFFA